MAKRFGPQIKRLQSAINGKADDKIMINRSQYYNDVIGSPIEVLVIQKVVCNPNRQRKRYVEVFSTTSDVQILLWLRDYWYEINGWEIPTDNEKWNQAKANYQLRREKKVIKNGKKNKKETTS